MTRRATRSSAAVAGLLGVAAAACHEAGGSNPPPVELAPKQVAVVIDLSGSQPAHALRQSRQYLERLVEDLSYGDQVVLLEMQRRRANEDVRRHVHTMPMLRRVDFESSIDREELAGARDALRAIAPIFFDSAAAGRIPTTDVLSTLHVVEQHLRDAGNRRKQIVLLSDMLQSTPGMDFGDGSRAPAATWIAQRKAEGLVPDLSGACVVVIGADATTGPGVRARRFWAEYFEAAGAELRPENWRLIAPKQPIAC